jgi:hypothetical protein
MRFRHPFLVSGVVAQGGQSWPVEAGVIDVPEDVGRTEGWQRAPAAPVMPTVAEPEPSAEAVSEPEQADVPSPEVSEPTPAADIEPPKPDRKTRPFRAKG